MKKNLAKFIKKERKRILDLKRQILSGDLSGLDVKRLKGGREAYRIRKGNFRIIFAKKSDGSIIFIAMERRSESTYRNR